MVSNNKEHNTDVSGTAWAGLTQEEGHTRKELCDIGVSTQVKIIILITQGCRQQPGTPGRRLSLEMVLWAWLRHSAFSNLYFPVSRQDVFTLLEEQQYVAERVRTKRDSPLVSHSSPGTLWTHELLKKHHYLLVCQSRVNNSPMHTQWIVGTVSPYS